MTQPEGAVDQSLSAKGTRSRGIPCGGQGSEVRRTAATRSLGFRHDHILQASCRLRAPDWTGSRHVGQIRAGRPAYCAFRARAACCLGVLRLPPIFRATAAGFFFVGCLSVI